MLTNFSAIRNPRKIWDHFYAPWPPVSNILGISTVCQAEACLYQLSTLRSGMREKWARLFVTTTNHAPNQGGNQQIKVADGPACLRSWDFFSPK